MQASWGPLQAAAARHAGIGPACLIRLPPGALPCALPHACCHCSPPPPVSCLVDPVWTAVKSRLTAPTYPSFFNPAATFPATTGAWASYSPFDVR